MPPAPESIRSLLRADPGADPLGRHPTDARPGIAGKPAAIAAAGVNADRLGGLQERLWAERSRAVLVVLQGMDTSGKSGTIGHVFDAVNPQGVRVTGFKAPTDEERREHFLERIRRALPPPGCVGVFDRSHYEDVLVPRVHGVDEARWRGRYDEINRFEEQLGTSGTVVVKCLLHISYDTQRDRLLARLADPDKHWKFNESDIDERRRWPAYQDAYRDAVRLCSEAAPWYVVPADRKWYRNWAVGRIVTETLEEMGPRFPHPPLDVAVLEARLAPPG